MYINRVTQLHALVVAALISASALAIDPAAPFHEQILQGLTEHPTRDQVIPWQPDVSDVALMSNREAPVPPQCYTDISEGFGTEGWHNPCYACHQNEIADRENKQNDRDLQEAYSFSDVGLTNHWFNLFEDRSARVAAITDEEILDWVDDDNYSELAGRLLAAGWGNDDYPGWDSHNAAVFGEPWLPDLANLQEGAAAFDERGLALDGSWWVAFNYKPLPSTFWPTNGSTDDVMIRLQPAFWKTRSGVDSLDVYWANLALVEANTKGLSRMDTFPIDEVAIGEDVNGDGVLEAAVTEVVITTNRKPTVEGDKNFYVGKAGQEEFIEPSMYPLGTEFLHTVRYVGVDEQGGIYNARRMKEVRYMRRYRRGRVWDAELLYLEELLAKEDGALPTFLNHGHSGLAKTFGWQVIGFIEAYDGRLRMNTYEENAFCMGCHSAVGSTIDKTFSFPRKVDGAAGWGYINLKGMAEVPNIGETQGEVFTYMSRVGGGTEFRSNPELEARFYHPDGSLNTVAMASARDVYDLITPSRERALTLNKAYKVIVEDQDFIYGRDATVTPPQRVLSAVDNDNSPTLPPDRQFDWNIVLDWQAEDDMQCAFTGDVDFNQLSDAHVFRIGAGEGKSDRVCANGTVTLAGDAVIEFNDGYTPVVGDRFDLVIAEEIFGDFDNLQVPPADNGQFWFTRTQNKLTLTFESLVGTTPACSVAPLPVVCAIPDVSGNGAMELAVSVGNHVQLRDASNGTMINDINFGADPDLDMRALPDMDGNGFAEIVILSEQVGGQIRARVKDASSGNVVSSPWYGTRYSGIEMAVIPDSNGNGAHDVAVLGLDPGNNRVRMMARNAKTLVTTNAVYMGAAFAPSHVTNVPAGTAGSAKIVVTGRHVRSGQVIARVYNPHSSALQLQFNLGKAYEPVRTLGILDVDSSGAGEIVALGLNPATGDGRLQIRDASNGNKIRSMALGAESVVLDVAVVEDRDVPGEDPDQNQVSDIAVLSRKPSGFALVRVFDSISGNLNTEIGFDGLENPLGVVALSDTNGNGTDEIAVLGETGGVTYVQVRDSRDGALLNSVAFP